MARKSNAAGQIAQQLLVAFLKLPWKIQVAIIVCVVIGGVVFLHATRERTQPGPPGARTVVFCLWNMENLFDDKDDRRRQPDEDFDAWFVNDSAARQAKYQRITAALLKLNDNNGPDLIVGNEIESRRAAELLRDSLNANLPDGAQSYKHVAMIELDAGRHIAPCVISRYPLSGAKLLGRRQRILEVHVTVNGSDLTLIASHWTSQLSDKGEDETRGRFAYANTIHDAYSQAIRANPTIDFLVCGDFNDKPEADSVARHLHLTGDASLVTPQSNRPMLFGPLSNKPAEQFGTHYYREPLIYDQIGLSPGLLDTAGWIYAANSIQVPTDGLIRSGARTRQPWRFGTKSDDAVGRGYSDHFPVLATFHIAGNE